MFDTSEGEARNGVVEIDFDEEEAFVVAKTDVVTRVKFFDEFAFEEEGFGFAADDVIIEIVNAFDERAEFEVPTHAAGRLEILGDAFAEVAGFADVDDRAEAVAHKINARLVREVAQLFLDVVGQRHAKDKLQVEGGRLQVGYGGSIGVPIFSKERYQCYANVLM